jgi:hypothetical protein
VYYSICAFPVMKSRKHPPGLAEFAPVAHKPIERGIRRSRTGEHCRRGRQCGTGMHQYSATTAQCGAGHTSGGEFYDYTDDAGYHPQVQNCAGRW